MDGARPLKEGRHRPLTVGAEYVCVVIEVTYRLGGVGVPESFMVLKELQAVGDF